VSVRNATALRGRLYVRLNGRAVAASHGCRFEPGRTSSAPPCGVAQLAERRIVNPDVTGSRPVTAAQEDSR
jgi:hypothetical protein